MVSYIRSMVLLMFYHGDLSSWGFYIQGFREGTKKIHLFVGLLVSSQSTNG